MGSIFTVVPFVSSLCMGEKKKNLYEKIKIVSATQKPFSSGLITRDCVGAIFWSMHFKVQSPKLVYTKGHPLPCLRKHISRE